MRIIGSVSDGRIMLLNNEGQFIFMEANYVRELCKKNADKTVHIAQAGMLGDFKECRAGLAINKDGRISARCGKPLYIKEVLSPEVNRGETIINGLSLGNAYEIKVLIEDESGYHNVRILHYPKIGYIKVFPVDVDVSMLFGSLSVYNIARSDKFRNTWVRGVVIDGRLELLLKSNIHVDRLIGALENKGIVLIPYCNIGTGAFNDYVYDKGSYLECDPVELLCAWNEMQGLKSSVPTNFKVDWLGRGAYRVIKCKDRSRVDVEIGVIFRVVSGKLVVERL